MKADLAIYSLVVGMSGLWVNVATMLNNKLDFYCCDNSVGFCKSSHICSWPATSVNLDMYIRTYITMF